MIFFETDILGSIVWFVVFFIFIILYPRIMLSQMIVKLEESARKLEKMSMDANTMAAKKVSKSAPKEIMTKIGEFTEFFVVEPSNLDPYGIVRKIDETINLMENRFVEFSEEIAGGMTQKEKDEVNYGLRAAIGLRQVAKVVRHYVEFAKKFKNLQIAMVIQMQLPIIEKIAEGEFKGTEAFLNGWPIGDSIGPLCATSYIDKSKKIATDIVCGETEIEGRKCFVLKATGPGPHLGRIDEAIEAIMKKNKIARVVTIDAAQKLEGEKTGSVAEGVGFAMGGVGQREMIENSLLGKKIPIDGVIVKVGMVEAIMPMRKAVFDSVDRVHDFVKRSALRTKKNEKLIVIGVGNSSGIGDTKSCIPEVKKQVEDFEKKAKEAEKKEKKGGWL